MRSAEDDATILQTLRAAFPAEGLFADKEFLLSPEPFQLGDELREELGKLGYRLHLFAKACNTLYHLSITGRQPAWIADYLDRGKPPELIELSRRREFRNDIPRIIRPDLVLTEDGFTIAELDNVPGGIGLTGWLNHTYAALGHDVLGGPLGMIDGFRAITGQPADILISHEAATYRPEMEWLNRMAGGTLPVHQVEEYALPSSSFSSSSSSSPPDTFPKNLYRFFELFDLPNIPTAPAIMAAVERGEARITPPFKPYLEEKLWFALFWMHPLREFWRRELSERHFLALQKHIPYTWLIDPAPLPQHAVIPGLDVVNWSEVGGFSQKQRDLILKISGFSELGWGSRSVVLGSDSSHHQWRDAIENAVRSFEHHPYILQRFHKGRLYEQPYFDPTTAQVITMRGRVRLCPYYFLINEKAELRGALATICPADKKLLHGMKDAVLAPAG
jgi:hypothetical protein